MTNKSETAEIRPEAAEELQAPRGSRLRWIFLGGGAAALVLIAAGATLWWLGAGGWGRHSPLSPSLTLSPARVASTV